MGTAPLLELTDVRARYGQVTALHAVSLAVEQGQAVAVLGPNGAGKTTTLRAVSGTVKKSGDVTFAGKRISRRSPEAIAALGIAHVPEGRGTFGELTVWENLRLGAYRRPRKAFKEDAGRVLKHFPWIEMRRDQQAGTLSGGEQQMLAVARAMVQRPRLVMLDEPSLGLAPLVVAQIFRVLQTLIEEDGLSALVVEQNANLALANSARAYVLEAGRVALEGTSEELSRDESVRESYLGY